MHRLYGSVILLIMIYGCGPPSELKQMHAAYNTRQWAGVTERFADMGRPQDLDGIAYARVAIAAERVHVEARSPAYRELAIDSYILACQKDHSLADEHYYDMGLLLEQTGDHEGAIRAYRDALAINPQHVPASCRAANLLADSGKATDIIAVSQGLLKVRTPVNRSLLEGLLTLSQAYADMGNKRAAMDVLRHASELGPVAWSPDVLYGLARYLEADKENGKARLTMRKAIMMLPDDDSRQGRFQRYLQQLEAAAQAMAAGGTVRPADSGATASPPPPPGKSDNTGISAGTPEPPPAPPPADSPQAQAAALAAEASLLADEGKTAEAIVLLTKAVELAPDMPAPAAQLAVLHVKEGNMAAAIAVLERALQHNPDNNVLKTMLGRIREANPTASQPSS